MVPHDIFAMYSAKATEYLIAIGFLLLFMPFWRFVNGGAAAEAGALATAKQWLGQFADWFLVPDNVQFHPGHAWARLANGVARVGIDDFAQKLVGNVSALALPAVGTRLRQGEPAWSLGSGAKAIPMLSPIDGTVVAVNERLAAEPHRLQRDPYGEGWLLEVSPLRPAANSKQLLSGNLARRWMEEASEQLQTMMRPDLGRVYQDGGLPVDGIARSLDEEHWDDVCRRFFLT